MDAAKKTELEKRIVIGLVGVFAVTLFLGPLRGLRVFARSDPAGGAPPPPETVSVSQPLGVMLQQHWQRMDDQQVELQQQQVHLAQAATGPPLYAAQDLRDPLESLLPRPEPQGLSPSAASPASPGGENVSAPKLAVQGIVWGGSEPVAIINNRVYGIDDMVEGGKILAIDRWGVTVDSGGQVVSYGPTSRTVISDARTAPVPTQ